MVFQILAPMSATRTRAYAELAVRRRKQILAATAVLGAVLVLGLDKLEFRANYRIWFDEDSAALRDHDAMVDKFGKDGFVAMVFRDADRGVLNNRAIESIQRLSDALWKVDNVKRVDALTNFSTIRASRLDHASPAFAVSAGHVAAAGDQRDIFLWDADTWSPKRLIGHDGMVEHLELDGDALVSGSIDRTVRIWDVRTGRERQVLRGAPGQISALARVGSHVFAGSYKSVLAWDANTGRRLWRTDGHHDYVTKLVVDPARDRIFAAGRTITVHDPTDGRQLASWSAHEGFVTDLALTSDGGTLFSTGDDGRLIAWDTKTSTPTTRLHLAGLQALTLALDADDRSVIVGMSDGSIHAVPPSGLPIAVRIHSDWVTDLTVTATGTVFSASRDHDIGAQVPGQGPRTELLEAHQAPVRRVRLSPSEHRLYSLGDGGDVYVWDLEGRTIAARLRRAATEPPPDIAPLTGDPIGALELINNFRFPIEIRVAGLPKGEVGGGQQLRIENLPVPAAALCDSDEDCAAGQYCDYEVDEPACTSVTRISAHVRGTGVRLWAAGAVLARDGPITMQVPTAGAFGVTAVANRPLDPRTTIGELVAAFPSPKVRASVTAVLGTEDPAVFISPTDANAIAEQLGRDVAPAAHKLLTSHGQRRLSPLDLPMQPFRFREAAYHLLRPPIPPGKGKVINDALDTTLIAVRMQTPDAGVDPLEPALALRVGVEAAIAEEQPRSGYDYHLVGDIIQDTNFVGYAERDFTELFPLFFGAIFVMLVLVYRRLTGAVLPLVIVSLSVTLGLGAAGHFGAALNNVTVAVPQIVLAACIGNTVHLFNSYFDLVRGGKAPEDAAISATANNLGAGLLTTMSTAIGFLFLSWSNITPIATFGWMAAIGVIAAFVLSFTILPGILAMLPPKKRKPPPPRLHHPSHLVKAGPRWPSLDTIIDKLFRDLAGYINRSTVALLFIGVLVAAFCLSGFSKLTFDSNPLRFSDEASAFREAYAFIETHLNGPTGLKLIVDSGEPGGVRKVDKLRELAKITEYIRTSSPEVLDVSGLSDTMQAVNRAMNQDLDDNFRLPNTDQHASAYYDSYTFSLPAGIDINHQVSQDESATLIDVRFTDQSAGWMLDWGAALQEWVESQQMASTVTITGVTWLFSNMLREISRGFFENFGPAVLVICLIMMFIARSPALGLVACVANLLPLAMTVGLLAHAGESLDTSVLVSCCIGMGIVVDDSIHFVERYRRLRAAGLDHDHATIETISHVGKAVVFTTIILVTGLGLFTLSDFVLNRNSGITVAIMLTFGMWFDLMILPPMIKVFHRWH